MQLMTEQDVLQHIERVKIVAILRGDFEGAWLDIAAALVEGGVEAIEVTFSCADALAGIEAIYNRYGSQIAIGAGTVLAPKQVNQAVDHGARYIIAPNTNPTVIEWALKRGVLVIPGAYTATEIEYAYRLGAGLIKLFPAMPSGPAYLKAIRGPFPDIPIMATGGVDASNLTDFLKAGANALGMGSLTGRDAPDAAGLQRIHERAQQAVSLVQSVNA
ncbi:MAG: bifunctional 4-hydroxy-2-oxoglutarate aldolase/2-dehydro-3-deoxy-phosphogluconate aldolase [Anaerolineae bacterium]|nr:bifunctional 4-hydroxy-2-oxoglutarate aldolase/2-dehydro-3-deoxy-phosphogluconate aldolase [Anaerolineae bacterium]